VGVVILFCLLFSFFESKSISEQILTSREQKDRKFAGYIKAEYLFDTRQVDALRSDQTLLYPRRKLPGSDEEDINAHKQLNMLSIESRLSYTLFTEKIKCLEIPARAVLEGDFWGRTPNSDDLPGGYRLRHSFIELHFKDVLFTLGQTWHPFTVTDCYPDTISFNSGAPYEPTARNGGVIVKFTKEKIQLISSLFSQLNFNNDGPRGFTNRYIREALMPDIHVQVRYMDEKNLFGVCYNIKRLMPRIVTNNGFSTNESIFSNAVSIFYGYTHPVFSFRSRYVWIQNGTEFFMVGGYGVHSIDQITDKRTYANISTSNLWVDMDILLHDTVKPGLFIGYFYNHGSFQTILPDRIIDDVLIERRSYGIGQDIGQSVRVEPRLRLLYDPISFCFELEMTAAAYGKPNEYKKIKNQQWVQNTRFAFSMFYKF